MSTAVEPGGRASFWGKVFDGPFTCKWRRTPANSFGAASPPLELRASADVCWNQVYDLFLDNFIRLLSAKEAESVARDGQEQLGPTGPACDLGS